MSSLGLEKLQQETAMHALRLYIHWLSDSCCPMISSVARCEPMQFSYIILASKTGINVPKNYFRVRGEAAWEASLECSYCEQAIR